MKTNLLGRYVTPRFRYGRKVTCLMRGRVQTVGITAGRIPWPVGKRGSAKGPVVYRDLAKALKVESRLAICYWWGVTGQTVSKWRKALGIRPVTPGTSKLKRDNFNQPWGQRARRKAWKAPRDPVKMQRLSDSKRGVPRPPGVMAAAHAANRGRRPTAETRAKMSAAAKRWGTRPPARKKG
jgi:hypothetical protein